jgi:vancomycin permeability regulator SanA
MSVLQIVLMICGAGVALFNYTVFLVTSKNNALPIAPIALFFIIAPPLLCVFLGGYAMANFPVLYEVLKWVYIALGLIYAATFFAFSAYVTAKVEQTEDADVFIVFGCKTFGYTPSYALKKRLDRTLELLQKNPASVAVLSGGQGKDETVAEAEAMKAYLVNKGINTDRLIVEDRSTSTVENLDYSMEILKGMGLDNKKISAVSNDFHIKRIMKLIKEKGCYMGVAYAEIDDFLRRTQNLTREYMVWIRTVLFKKANARNRS